MALVFKDAMQNLLKRRSKSDLNNRMTTLLKQALKNKCQKLVRVLHF